MPQYFFTIQASNGNHEDDRIGKVFPDIMAALAQAERMICELRKEGGYDDTGLNMLVKDENSTDGLIFAVRRMRRLRAGFAATSAARCKNLRWGVDCSERRCAFPQRSPATAASVMPLNFQARVYSAKPSTMNALEFVVLARMALIASMSDASAQPCAFSLLSKARTTKRSGGAPSSAVIVMDRMM